MFGWAYDSFDRGLAMSEGKENGDKGWGIFFLFSYLLDII